MARPPTLDEIYDVARQAVDIFRSYDLDTCLFGSAACSLYGVDRTPNDVDLVVLTNDYDQEELKELLVNTSSSFYLVPSQNRFATYSVLWCKLPRRGRGNRGGNRGCKVDILVPGVLNIPAVPRRRVRTLAGLPAMPLVPLLLLKLQGWSNHRDSRRADMQEKQYVDVEDILALLQIALNPCEQIMAILENAPERGQRIDQGGPAWMPRTLVWDSEPRVREFVSIYPQSEISWQACGLY